MIRILPEDEKSKSILSIQEGLEGRDQQYVYGIWQYSIKLRRETIKASKVE